MSKKFEREYMEKEPLLNQVLDDFILNLNSDSSEENNYENTDFFWKWDDLKTSLRIFNFEDVETTATNLNTFAQYESNSV